MAFISNQWIFEQLNVRQTCLKMYVAFITSKIIAFERYMYASIQALIFTTCKRIRFV